MVLVGDHNFTPLASPIWRTTLVHSGVQVIAPPSRQLATTQDRVERAFLRQVGNRIKTLVGLLKGSHGLETRGVRSWWYLLTRVTSALAAVILARSCFHPTLRATP